MMTGLGLYIGVWLALGGRDIPYMPPIIYIMLWMSVPGGIYIFMPTCGVCKGGMIPLLFDGVGGMVERVL
jgi:hypothetical protein